jgi:hypothetical protein
MNRLIWAVGGVLCKLRKWNSDLEQWTDFIMVSLPDAVVCRQLTLIFIGWDREPIAETSGTSVWLTMAYMTSRQMARVP